MSRGPGCGRKWSIRRVDGLVHPCDHCIQMLELVVGLVVLGRVYFAASTQRAYPAIKRGEIPVDVTRA